MALFRKGLFIINPNAGKKDQHLLSILEEDIQSLCSQNSVECSISFTNRAGHATHLAKEAVEKSVDIVFAVGGDGTVNEVAKGLIHSSTTLGIIPKGSGNGLARHLGISMNQTRALSLLHTGKSLLMDTLSFNGEISVNVSGIGFDGHVANLFEKSVNRGLQQYVKIAATEFFSFKTFRVDATIDDKPFQSDAHIVVLANSSQFGNNATLSPSASVRDGLMDICVIKKVPVWHSAGFLAKMFTKQIHTSRFVEIVKAKKISISFSSDMPFHVDGEGRGVSREFHILVVPSSLRILVDASRKAFI